jgi:Tol biopolymer transport system component
MRSLQHLTVRALSPPERRGVVSRLQAVVSLLFLLSFAALVLGGCDGAGGQPPADISEGTPRIVFTSERGGEGDLYSISEDGSDVRRLTDFGAFFPSYATFNSKIAFMSYRDDDRATELYLMDGDGSNVVRLTRDPDSDSAPGLSADGSKVVFSSTRMGDEHLYVMDADGSGVTQLTREFDSNPVFSPDGSQIAFTSFRDDDDELYLMNANGTGVTRLTTVEGSDYHPSFSPDGSRIVFMSYRGVDVSAGKFDPDMYIMNTDGSEVTRLIGTNTEERRPCFSPDGSRIAFVRNGNVYTMNTDGSNISQLTTDGSISYVSWGGGTR